MFLYLLAIVLIVGSAQVYMTYQELDPWLRERARLRVERRKGLITPFKFYLESLRILPLVWPAFFDGIVIIIAGGMGLSGSLIGATATMFMGFVTSCILKYQRHHKSKKMEAVYE